MFDTEQQSKISGLRERISNFKSEKTEIDRQIAEAERDLKLALAEDNFYKFMVESLSRENVCTFFSNMDPSCIVKFVNGFEWRMKDMLNESVPTMKKQFVREDKSAGLPFDSGKAIVDSKNEVDGSNVNDGVNVVSDGSSEDVDKLLGFAKNIMPDLVPEDRAVDSIVKDESSKGVSGDVPVFRKAGDFSKALNSIRTVPSRRDKGDDDKLELPKGFSSFSKKE